MTKYEPVTTDQWQQLRTTTRARIALGRAGGSLSTNEWLGFKAAHAAARVAVHNSFESEQLATQIANLGVNVVIVESMAPDRITFLQRPDFGRRLNDVSRCMLQESARPNSPADLAIILSDGLSALAVERHAPPLLSALLPQLAADGWRLTPIVIARFGRVALQDEIGSILGAKVALTLLGERPGLGSPDSLGAYLVFAPQPGNTDANRNCVSNIRPEGLGYSAATETIHYLLSEARRCRQSGVQLKDQRSILAGEKLRSIEP